MDGEGLVVTAIKVKGSIEIWVHLAKYEPGVGMRLLPGQNLTLESADRLVGVYNETQREWKEKR